MRRFAVPLLVAAALGCGIDLPDLPGRACDQDHPCRSGRDCVAGRCFAPGELDGGAGGPGGGGGGGGSGGGTGGGAPADAGRVLWSQSREGFNTQSVGAGCALEVDPLRQNRVASTVASALDGADRAYALQTDAGALELSGNGRLRGRFQVPSALALLGQSVWLQLGTGTALLAQLSFQANGSMQCTAAAGTIHPQAVTQTVTWGGGFQPNRDYLVDIQWRRGQFRRVYVDGTLLAEATLNDPGTAFAAPQELRVGISRYDGTADAGWTITLTGWQLGEEPETPLSD